MDTENHMTRAFSAIGDLLATALRWRSPDSLGTLVYVMVR